MQAEQGAAIRYFTPPSGEVTSISGAEQAKSMPDVRIVELDTKLGELVPEFTSSLSRVGHVIATGTTAEQAIACAEAARDTVRIVTEPGRWRQSPVRQYAGGRDWPTEAVITVKP